MAQQQTAVIIGEIVDAMADRALANGEHIIIAIEHFSTAIDRLLSWLPGRLRDDALQFARAHGYCTPEQLERLRLEGRRSH